MKSKSCFFFLALIFFTHCISAQIIPEANRVDWSGAGYPGDFPEPVSIANIMDFGATGDGVTDDRAAIVSAIASFSNQPGVVFIPAGTYKVSSSISIPSAIVLRGEGAASTYIKFDMGGSAINGFSIAGSINGTEIPVLSGYTKNSTQLVIDVSNENFFAEGDYVELRQSNGTWDTNPATWATYSVGQIAKIIAIAGTTLTLDQQLRIDYDAALNPHLRKLTPKINVGIECMNLERVDEPVSGAGYNILFANAANCWVKGIESNKSVGSHVMIEACTNIEVRGSYFHDAFTYDGTGTRGYGVTLNNHSGLCLIENNMFRHLRHAMMTKHGANGNVFGYNYSIEPFRSETPSNAGGDISLHGHFSYANLFEGNIVQNIMIDHYWGPSGPYNTFFRNRGELYGIVMTTDNGYATNMQNFVGNDCPNTGLFMGNYVLTGTGHIQHGNNIRGTVNPAGTSSVDDISYYLDDEPGFWINAGTYPSIGYPNAGNTGTIPAKVRYLAGGDITVCNDEIITSADDDFTGEQMFMVFPNPFSDGCELRFTNEVNGTFGFALYDVTGKLIIKKANLKGNNYLLKTETLEQGIYIAEVTTADEVYRGRGMKR